MFSHFHGVKRIEIKPQPITKKSTAKRRPSVNVDPNDSDDSGDKSPARKTTKIRLPIHNIIRTMTMPQPMAAKKLGVSISTLKRRYYELKMGRWPVSNINSTLYFEEEEVKCEHKPKLGTILNKFDLEDQKAIDTITEAVLMIAFKAQEL